MNSFIKGQKTTLDDFITLLTNLCITCMFMVRGQLKSHYSPPIWWYFQETVAIVTLPAFNSWHTKHQGSCPWLTHTLIAAMQPLFACLHNISLNFESQETLALGDTLPHDNCAIILCLMQEILERLQLGMNTNSIAQYGQEQQSHRHFQYSTEGIPPQPNIPNYRQRNKVNHNQPRQQDNRRQQ